MILEEIILKNFRNFADSTIRLKEKSLIIGANDIGKSNLFYALRILLDRSLSEADLEPRESDFCAFTDSDELSITLKFSSVDEDCVIAKLREHRSNDGEIYLQYIAKKKANVDHSSYLFRAGKSMDCLTEIQSRFYLKVLNLRYLGSNRDLFSYIRSEKKYLLHDAQENRSDTEKNADVKILKEIGNHLDKVNKEVRGLNYVKAATSSLNSELSKLAFHHTKEDVVFDVGAADPDGFTQNLRLAIERDGRILEVGGDGRNNQVFMALWSSRNAVSKSDLEFTIHCVEEPEAHLHPHQQRKLAEYLVKSVPGQVIISSHSSQIAAEFSPNSIIRLRKINDEATVAASEGCSEVIKEALFDFGYRLDAINAETFYAATVFLVEGPSEVLFFRALARALDIDLDRMNISVTMVDGVGFLPYVQMLDALEVPWVVRTDNDIFKVPRTNYYRLAGFQRAIDIAQSSYRLNTKDKALLAEIKPKIAKLTESRVPTSLLPELKELRQLLKSCNIFLARQDLESDLTQSDIQDDLALYYGEKDLALLLEEMQAHKATGMFDFLQANTDCLQKLNGSAFHKQLQRCQKLVSGT